MENPVVLPCGHTICAACAEKIRVVRGRRPNNINNMKPRCPCCRKPFKTYIANYFARQVCFMSAARSTGRTEVVSYHYLLLGISGFGTLLATSVVGYLNNSAGLCAPFTCGILG
eukprot:1399619-Pyramimonas_sp.AAC.4